MDLKTTFSNVAAKMNADFESARSALSHAGLKGTANEQTFKDFLSKHITKQIEVSSGIAIDKYSCSSRQLDIILHDRSRTPVLFTSGNTQVIPIECVYAGIEVKAQLNHNELKKSFKNMNSLKKLTKDAYVLQESPIRTKIRIYDKEWFYWPTQHFVFAYDSIPLQTLVDSLASWQADLAPEARIDCVCVLNRGVILNHVNWEQFGACPGYNTELGVYETRNALFLFYCLLMSIYPHAWLPPIRFLDYVSKIEF